MFTYTLLNKSGYLFSPGDPTAVHEDKMRGIIKFGPYRKVTHTPKIAFVFPEGHRDSANRLYLALRNGIGLFKGLPNVFRLPLEKEQVFPITGFTLKSRYDHHDSARRYRDAICNWVQAHNVKPDVFVNLHPRSMAWEEDSEYTATKAALLQEGLLSQNVTFDLLQNATQFEWSAANIALGLFVKLGGIPWAVNRPNSDGEIVIGMGRSESFDPSTRKRKRAIAFITCLQSNGLYQFAHFGRACTEQGDFLRELEATLRQALAKVMSANSDVRSLTLHFPKEFSYDERGLCSSVASEMKATFQRIEFVKVTQEDRFFALDDEVSDQVPRRGTCIRLNSSDYLLYTEGSEERQTWANRPPSAVRIRHYRDTATDLNTREVVGQVFDLSLSNWRAFNARSYPVSIFYSSLISHILQSTDLSQVHGEHLQDRMWFL